MFVLECSLHHAGSLQETSYLSSFFRFVRAELVRLELSLTSKDLIIFNTGSCSRLVKAKIQ